MYLDSDLGVMVNRDGRCESEKVQEDVFHHRKAEGQKEKTNASRRFLFATWKIGFGDWPKLNVRY